MTMATPVLLFATKTGKLTHTNIPSRRLLRNPRQDLPRSGPPVGISKPMAPLRLTEMLLHTMRQASFDAKHIPFPYPPPTIQALRACLRLVLGAICQYVARWFCEMALLAMAVGVRHGVVQNAGRVIRAGDLQGDAQGLHAARNRIGHRDEQTKGVLRCGRRAIAAHDKARDTRTATDICMCIGTCMCVCPLCVVRRGSLGLFRWTLFVGLVSLDSLRWANISICV